MGRSRGGLTTKIHVLVNEWGLPLNIHLTPGQAHDGPVAPLLLDELQPGQAVLADKAYDANHIRGLIWEKGAEAVIPSKSDRKIPVPFDRDLYRQRNKVERFIGRIKKSFRRISTRYDKTSDAFLAFIKLATVRIWCEAYESAT
jgi:transposase